MRIRKVPLAGARQNLLAKLTRGLAALALLVAFAQGASAATKTFTLDQDGCSGSCGTGPFGTITLTEITAFQVDVLVTLIAPVKFVKTSTGDSLAFTLTPGIGITLTNITAGFAQDGSPKGINNSGFSYGVDCTTGCGNGTSNPNPGPLSFSVTGNAPITVSSFIANGAGYFFSSDIIGPTGRNGNVGSKVGTAGGNSNDISVDVPEPASLALLGAGFIGLAALRRRQS